MKIWAPLSVLLFLAQAEAAALAPREPVALAEPQPVSLPEASVLEKRDVWCRVQPDEVYVRCREGPSTQKRVLKWIRADERFGVRCKKKGENISGVVYVLPRLELR